jgi:hypothetical protein
MVEKDKKIDHDSGYQKERHIVGTLQIPIALSWCSLLASFDLLSSPLTSMAATTTTPNVSPSENASKRVLSRFPVLSASRGSVKIYLRYLRRSITGSGLAE